MPYKNKEDKRNNARKHYKVWNERRRKKYAESAKLQQKQKEYKAKYAKEHPDKLKESKQKDYQKHKEKYGERANKAHLKGKELVDNIKKSSKCIRCGFSDYRALDFHHIDPNTKEFTISSSTTQTIKRLLAEIEKCEILCANCHRIKHYEMREKGD